MKYSSNHDIEQLLIDSASRLPEPQKPVPISESMKKRTNTVLLALHTLWQHSAWRAAMIALLVLCIGTTTALAASPELREAVIRFFTSGTVEQPPIDRLNTGTEGAQETASGSFAYQNDPDPLVQTVGNLTLVQPAALDSHFSAFYASSNDYLELIHTPSGKPLFCTRPQDAAPSYYALEDGILREIVLESRTLTASVQLGQLPGVMGHDGRTDFWKVTLPVMEFTVSWQQYGDDILIDYSDTDYRFDIGSTFGGLQDDYDGRFYSRAIPGRSDVVQVFFNFDGQQTEYEYPFLVYLDTGRVSDPLAQIDLSAYPCITELAISDDLLHATAQAGDDHEHQHTLMIDLQTGVITEAASLMPPVADCYIWFPTGEHTLFYGAGSDDALDGYLYDSLTDRSTLLFSGAASYAYEDGFAERYYDFIGGGFAIYYEGESVFLLDLHDGSFTLLEGIPASRNIDFFFNPDFTVLSISFLREDGNTKRLGFIILKTREAVYFDRELPDGINEESASWYAPYGYMIQATDEARERWYLYLYCYED